MAKILKVVGASWMQTKISSYILLVLGILAILALFAAQIERIQEDGNYAATVFFSEKTGYRIEYWGQSNDLADIPRGVARCYFRGDVDTNGWSVLEIETNGEYADYIQAYAAGIVEGAITWYLIHSHLENTVRAKCTESEEMEAACDDASDILTKAADKWKTYAEEREDDDPFWHQVSLYYSQIDGIYSGWKFGIERNQLEYDSSLRELHWLNAVSEISELQRTWKQQVKDSTFDHLPGLSSALVRIVNETSVNGTDFRKLFVAQNAAGSYSSMTRLLKRYKFNYKMTSKSITTVPGVFVDFSGYPGTITSLDELYILKGEADSHRIAVTGTDLKIYNQQLEHVDIDKEVPIGPRITAANHLASNVTAWAHVLATYNSGTSAKQWMVVDFNKFDQLNETTSDILATEPKEVITEISIVNGVKHTVVHRNKMNHKTGILYLIEQVPGLTHARDISSTFLEQGYWATYGLPYIEDISKATKVPQMLKKYGSVFSISESPRSLLFKRGMKNATSLDSIIKLMRQNNITAISKANNVNDLPCNDEVECIIRRGEYLSVIGVRGDLVSHLNEAYGVIDTKVVSSSSINRTIELVAIAGPPYTEIQNLNSTSTPVNKGNIASVYTDKFDNEATIDGLEIRNLVKQQQEKAEHEALEILNKNSVKPFQWSESEFYNKTHENLPDKWAFSSYRPRWSW